MKCTQPMKKTKKKKNKKKEFKNLHIKFCDFC